LRNSALALFNDGANYLFSKYRLWALIFKIPAIWQSYPRDVGPNAAALFASAQAGPGQYGAGVLNLFSPITHFLVG